MGPESCRVCRNNANYMVITPFNVIQCRALGAESYPPGPGSYPPPVVRDPAPSVSGPIELQLQLRKMELEFAERREQRQLADRREARAHEREAREHE